MVGSGGSLANQETADVTRAEAVRGKRVPSRPADGWSALRQCSGVNSRRQRFIQLQVAIEQPGFAFEPIPTARVSQP